MKNKPPRTTNYEQLTKGSSKHKGVQNFADFVGESSHKRFDEMDGQTIYIVKLEVFPSDKFGAGYRVHFKDLPNARETYTASCFGEYIVPVLDNVYKLTHDGKMISLDSPIKTTFRKAGRTYRFE